METTYIRTYCPRCLRYLGIKDTPKHLKRFESKGVFPKRIGPSTWNAEEVDKWYLAATGVHPPILICRS